MSDVKELIEKVAFLCEVQDLCNKHGFYLDTDSSGCIRVNPTGNRNVSITYDHDFVSCWLSDQEKMES